MKNIKQYINESQEKGIIYNDNRFKVISTGEVKYYIKDDEENEGTMDVDDSMNLNNYGDIGYTVEWSVTFDTLEFYYNNELYFIMHDVMLERSISDWRKIWFSVYWDNIVPQAEYTDIYKIKKRILDFIENIFWTLTDDEDEGEIAREHNKEVIKDIMDEIKEKCEEEDD